MDQPVVVGLRRSLQATGVFDWKAAQLVPSMDGETASSKQLRGQKVKDPALTEHCPLNVARLEEPVIH